MNLHRTKVGDRYVMEAMREHGFNVGGEQSGHLILGDHSTTGDALIAALQFLAALLEDGRPASMATRMFEPVPQLLKNVKCDTAVLSDSAVKNSIAEIENQLGKDGRIVVRASGTEPLVRIMIEGTDQKSITALADQLAATMEAAGSGKKKSA
jgi:phosphoglucosamine mutase